jgi:hypothetical protein
MRHSTKINCLPAQYQVAYHDHLSPICRRRWHYFRHHSVEVLMACVLILAWWLSFMLSDAWCYDWHVVCIIAVESDQIYYV